MKRLILASLYLMLTGFIFPVTAQTVKSDYKITNEFNRNVEWFSSEIKNSGSIEAIDSLVSQINDFESGYAKHENLLDKALYPNTFKGSIMELKERISDKKSTILLIGNKNSELKKIKKQYEHAAAEIYRLVRQTDSLQIALNQNKAENKDLKVLVSEYRENIRTRDRFILAVVDSLMLKDAYSDGNTESGLESIIAKGTLSEEQNPLIMINTIIKSQLESLKASGQQLEAVDYIRAYQLYKRVDQNWSSVGDKLISVYVPDDKNKWKREIEENLHDWGASASLNVWASIDKHFEINGIELPAFDNNYSFFIALKSFIKGEKRNRTNSIFKDSLSKDYTEFEALWNNDLKVEWGKPVVEANILNMQQIASVDEELSDWKETAKPASIFFPFLLGLSFLTIAGLLIIIVRGKEK